MSVFTMWSAQLLLLLFVTLCYGIEDRPLVQTRLGTIKGYIKTSTTGKKFAAFEGIPFAKPPIGSRRFEPPEPVEPWHGVWNATYLTECAQIGFMLPGQILGSEDCLHINIYVPRQKPNPEERLEVVVHIHGGAYMLGSGHLYARPDFIVDKDFIFVTFNYRVGILGFLSTEDDVVPGNNGMKDQVLALEWIQKNIASFGGNPDSVTLTGLSAGGASVHLHYFSELSKGLFHRGLAQSGVAFNAYSIQEGALEKAKFLANAVGCPTETTRILVDCLKERPHKHLLDTLNVFLQFSFVPIAPFAPVIEKSSKPFLSDHPYNLLQKRQINDVPLIASMCADEGYMAQMFIGTIGDRIEKEWNSIAPLLLDFNYTLDKSLWTSASEKIRKFYFDDKPITQDNFGSFVKMYGDRTFLVDGENAIRLHAKASKSPVYFYYFAYPRDNSTTKYVSHGADAQYFYTPVMDPSPMTENELKLKDIFINMLISYAKTGKPVIEGIDWKPTEYDKLTYLNISSYNAKEMSVKTADELSPRKFWRSLQFSENENLFQVKDEL